MKTANLVHVACSDAFYIECEHQTIFMRFFEPGTSKQIGSCSLNAGKVGHVYVKMFNVDSAHRALSDQIIKSIADSVAKLGFKYLHYERKTRAGFRPVTIEISR